MSKPISRDILAKALLSVFKLITNNKFRRYLLILPYSLFFSINALALEKPKVTEIEAFNKVLFVGNSFSYFNNGIHNHVSNLLRANKQWQAKKNRFRLMTLSGGKFTEQVATLPAFLKASKDKYDVVILQEYSTGPINPDYQADFIKASKKLISEVKSYDAVPVLFMTWEYKNNPEMTEKLAKQYLHIANMQQVLLLPVGLAFAQLRQTHPKVNLHTADFSAIKNGKSVYKKAIKHPSLAGSYLSACVIYASLYKQSPVGNLYFAGLDPKLASILQHQAWQTVKEFYGIDKI